MLYINFINLYIKFGAINLTEQDNIASYFLNLFGLLLAHNINTSFM